MSLVSNLWSQVAGFVSLSNFILLLLGLLLLAYWYVTKDIGKFEAKGLKSVKPSILYGNNAELFNLEKSPMQFHLDWYNKFKDEK